ncbi:indolepyruvate ferredoxin oxidoreductase subunit alpha, partial [Candidatus Aerophobetes bacterium]
MPKLRITGNEGIAYGAKDAGVGIVTGYPGLPSTSVIETLVKITSPDETYIQWSANEKVALEIAFGASIAGKRALVSQKMVGMNVCLDSLMVINLLGTGGGLVLA